MTDGLLILVYRNSQIAIRFMAHRRQDKCAPSLV
jgi:hypothetical protein